MIDFAVGVAMLHGHDPTDAREWAWRDLELLVKMHDLSQQPPEGQ